MRADRLVAIVLLLQTRGQLTAGELAELLETSERTVRRDLDALLVAGLPLYAQRGRGGGWALLGGNRLDLTGFTVQEAQALFLVAGSRSKGASTVDVALRSALQKVFAALPEPLRAAVSAEAVRTVVDPSGWGWRTDGDDAPLLDELRAAVQAGRQLDIDYARPGQAARRRRVQPYGLVAKNGVWYLLAGTADGRRMFRVSRVEAARVGEETVELPEGFDLAREWATAEQDFYRRMQLVRLRILVRDQAVLALTSSFDRWARVEDRLQAESGWQAFEILAPHVRAAAVHLAPFGADVRVVWPEELRGELVRIGRELVSANSPRGRTGEPVVRRGDEADAVGGTPR